MGAKIEYINLEGLRVDGRRPNEIRNLRFQLGIGDRADGTCYFEQGNTKVLSSVYGPREVAGAARTKKEADRASVTCNISTATFASGARRKVPPRDRRQADLCAAIGRAFEAVLFVDLYPNSQIEIFVQILQADGGEAAACITATTLAMVDAGIPMRDFLVACTAGYIDEVPLIGPELPVAILPQSKKVAFLQMDSKVALEMFDEVLATAVAGCGMVHKVLEDAIRSHAHSKLESRGIVYNR